MGHPMKIEAWVISFSCGLGDRATPCPPRGSLCSWLAYRTEFSSDHWPASGVGRHSRGCLVGGLLILPHDRLWVVPFFHFGQYLFYVGLLVVVTVHKKFHFHQLTNFIPLQTVHLPVAIVYDPGTCCTRSLLVSHLLPL
jgi:hypothetical protein